MKNPIKYLGNELKYLKKVLNSESWSATSGSWCQALEKEFAKKFNAKYAIAMNSGTATLHSALVACGVKQGDEVITPALSPFMCTAAILHAKGTPVYADIDERTFTIYPQDICEKITRKTKSIIAVSLYGLSPDMPQINGIASKFKIPVIEDNAQHLGQLTGDMASYSFESSKHLSCGEGGILITNDSDKAKIARKLAGHGFKNLEASEGRIRLNQSIYQDPKYKRHDMVGYNYRMSEFSAAIALAQLERINKIVSLREESAGIFLNIIDECDYLNPQLTPWGYWNSCYTLAVTYDRKDISWQDFRKEYIKQGGDGIYAAWSLPYQEPAIKGIKYCGTPCPIAEKLQPKIMQFKTNYRNLKLAQLKAKALKRTIECLK